MNRLTFATIAGGALTATALGLPAGAQAAPSGVGSAEDLLKALESSGYNVVLNKLGAGPLDRCTVDSVRPGAQIVYRTVYLTARC